jgi:hypothetical protein
MQIKIPVAVRSKSGVRLGGLKNEASKINPDFHLPMKDRDLPGRGVK